MTMLGKKKHLTPVLQAVTAFSGFPEKLFSPSSLKVTSSVQLMFCATLSSDILQQLASSAMASGLAAWRRAGGGIFFFCPRKNNEQLWVFLVA